MILRDNRKEIIRELKKIEEALNHNLKIYVFEIDDIIKKIEEGNKKEAKKELNEIVKDLSEFLSLRKKILEAFERSLNIITRTYYNIGEKGLVIDRMYNAVDPEKTYNRIVEEMLEIKKLIKELEKDIKIIREDIQKIKELNIKDNDEIFKYAIEFILRFNPERLESIANKLFEVAEVVVKHGDGEIYYTRSAEVMKELLSEFGIYLESIEEFVKFRNEIINREHAYEKIISEDIKALEQIAKKL